MIYVFSVCSEKNHDKYQSLLYVDWNWKWAGATFCFLELILWCKPVVWDPFVSKGITYLNVFRKTVFFIRDFRYYKFKRQLKKKPYKTFIIAAKMSTTCWERKAVFIIHLLFKQRRIECLNCMCYILIS